MLYIKGTSFKTLHEKIFLWTEVGLIGGIFAWLIVYVQAISLTNSKRASFLIQDPVTQGYHAISLSLK